MFALFLFLFFRSLLCLVLATLSVKNNFLWWVVNHRPLFLYLGVLFSIHSISLLSKTSKLVDNSSPLIELYYLKNIHSICILQTTAIRHHHRHHNHQSQTPRLDWSSLLCLHFVITCFSGFSASNPVIPSLITLRPSSTPWCSVIVTLRNPPSLQLQ